MIATILLLVLTSAMLLLIFAAGVAFGMRLPRKAAACETEEQRRQRERAEKELYMIRNYTGEVKRHEE